MTRSIAATQTSARTATGRDDWQTPPEVLERVRALGRIVLDPCTSEENPVGAAIFYTKADDGLALSWFDVTNHTGFDGLVFVNPPYSKAKEWASKVCREAIWQDGGFKSEIVTLCAARTDPAWFYTLCWSTAAAVCFWRGRLRFVGAPSSAPFPSCLVYHGPRPWAFESAFHDAGKVIRLR